MKKKIVTTLLISFVSVELVASGQGEKVDEKELVDKRLKSYKIYQKNIDKLKKCTVKHEGARGQSIYFPNNRYDIIMIENEGTFLAVKVKGEKVWTLWSMCQADNGKNKLKVSQYKSHLWKGLAKSYETGYQIGKFPSEFENGYDIFWTDQHLGKATRVDKNNREVCEYNNVNTGDMYIAAEPKITKLCKP